MIENVCHFVSANDDDSICYYAHCISRTGSYLSEGLRHCRGEAIAYLNEALPWRPCTAWMPR